MKRSLVLGVGFLFLVVPLALPGGEKEEKSKLDYSQRYLLLATRKTGTMQKELNEAAAAGYRVLVGSPTSGVEMALILEKVAEPPNTYEYFLLATSRTSTMQKELTEAAARGFRLLPRTMMAKKPAAKMFINVEDEVVLVLEKPPGTPTHYEYLLLATSRTSTLQKEMAEAVGAGFELIGMVSRDEHMAILEKPLK